MENYRALMFVQKFGLTYPDLPNDSQKDIWYKNILWHINIVKIFVFIYTIIIWRKPTQTLIWDQTVLII